MKIAVCDGNQAADYIINQINTKGNSVKVINSDKDICLYLSRKNNIDVTYGKSTKEYDLRCADIEKADLLIALSNSDVNNYVTCQMAKKIFNVRKVICVVMNPKNVEIFKEMGIDSVISSSYLLGETVKAEMSVEKMIKTLTFENNKIVISELEIKKNYKVCNHMLKDINFPENMSVCSIYRQTHLIIPKGDTEILANDKVLVVSSNEDQVAARKFIMQER